MSQAYIVIGPARTGTSLATGILKALGIYVGEHFKKESNNPHDYENYKLHRYLMCHEGTPQDIVEELDIRPKWCMKHPFLASRWSEFAPLIPRPKFIVTYRNLEQHLKSYRKVVGNDHRSLLIQEIQGVYDAVDRFAADRFDAQFEKWFEMPCTQLEKIADYVGLPVTRESKRIIHPEYVHFHKEQGEKRNG